MDEHEKERAVGTVREYFRKVGVAAVQIIRGKIRVGDTLKFYGHTTDFVQRVESIQENLQPIMEASEGDFVGIKVDQRVREGDLVFLESGSSGELT